MNTKQLLELAFEKLLDKVKDTEDVIITDDHIEFLIVESIKIIEELKNL
jgi:hypothetical protein